MGDEVGRIAVHMCTVPPSRLRACPGSRPEWGSGFCVVELLSWHGSKKAEPRLPVHGMRGARALWWQSCVQLYHSSGKAGDCPTLVPRVVSSPCGRFPCGLLCPSEAENVPELMPWPWGCRTVWGWGGGERAALCIWVGWGHMGHAMGYS